jgi:hypothetical protein
MQDGREKLVQVLYDPRFGMLAFHADGSVAQMVTLPNGKRTWRFAEVIWDECVMSDHEADLAAGAK